MGSLQPAMDIPVRSTTPEELDEPPEYKDPWGDIKLLVQAGERQKTFVVSSKVMCLASPVWRTMLDPESHYMEANSGNGEVSLQDDDHRALSILLDIAHMRFLKVPQCLKYEQLLEVSILCDKYDTVTLVRPWLPKWLKELEELPDRAGYEEWLFIAWVFGDSSTFMRIAFRLVLEMKISSCGKYTTATGVVLGNNMPPGIVDSILDARKATLVALLDHCYTNVDRFVVGVTQHCKYPNKEACDALALGLLIKGLGRMGLWPRPAVADISTSVTELSEQLKDLSLCTSQIIGSPHTKCNISPSFQLEVGSILQVKPRGVYKDSFRRHLEKQSKK